MKNKVNFNIRKAVSVAAAAVLCLCVFAAAANYFGFFRDVKDWTGAVVGTEYVQATGEIEVTAAAGQDTLAVTVSRLTPDAAPYSELETLGIGSYRIVDAAGAVIAEREGDALAAIADGKAVMAVPLTGIGKGEYRLLVSDLIGYKKADQPLPISGSWECGFTV